MPEKARPTHIGRPRESLNTQEVRDIIEFISMDYENRVLNWIQIHNELKLFYSVKTLKHRCKEAGYYFCICCQKPYFNKAQTNVK